MFLAVNDKKYKAVASLPMPCKETLSPYPMKRVQRQLGTWGRYKCILRSDQEAAIMDLKKQVTEGRMDETVLEEVPR